LLYTHTDGSCVNTATIVLLCVILSVCLSAQ